VHCYTAVAITNNNTKGGINCVETVGQSMDNSLAIIIDKLLVSWTIPKNSVNS